MSRDGRHVNKTKISPTNVKLHSIASVTRCGDTSLRTRRWSCFKGWYGKEVWCVQTLTAVLWLDGLSRNTEIRVPRTRRLNLESFDDSKTMFYTTLPFWNLMSFQRHLFAWDRLRPHYSGPFNLWCSASLPLPSSYITQTSYLCLTSSPRPYLCHTVTWASIMSHFGGQVLTEHVPCGSRWQHPTSPKHATIWSDIYGPHHPTPKEQGKGRHPVMSTCVRTALG